MISNVLQNRSSTLTILLYTNIHIFYKCTINKMIQQKPNPLDQSLLPDNPQNSALSPDSKDGKRKKKKFKTKKYIKSPNTHHPFTTDNPLYEVLNHDEDLNSNQLNFGPWIKQASKREHDFLPSIDLKPPSSGFISQQKHSRQMNSIQNQDMSKSQHLLSKLSPLTISTKLQKATSKSTYFKVPVWNAFIEEQVIPIGSKSHHYFSQRQLLKHRQATVSFEMQKRRTNINLVSIGSTEDLNPVKLINFNQRIRDQSNLSQKKMHGFKNYSSQKLDLLKKIRANAVVYNYCLENEGMLTPILSEVKEVEDAGQKKVFGGGVGEGKGEKNLKRRKQKIYEKKLSEMQLKLTMPQTRSKLVFISKQPQKPSASTQRAKPQPLSLNSQKQRLTVSKYTFMDLLQMRARVK